MKKIIFLLATFFFALCFASCDDEDESWITPENTFTSEAVANGYELPSEGGTFGLKFNHNGNKCEIETAGGSDYWKYCEVTKQSFNGGTYFEFIAKPYGGFSDLEMPIKFIVGNKSLIVKLTQIAPEHVKASKETWEVDADGAILNVKGYANCQFDVIIPDDDKAWVHCNNIEKGHYSDITIILRVDANHSDSSRSSRLSLKTVYGRTTGYIVISQLPSK